MDFTFIASIVCDSCAMIFSFVFGVIYLTRPRYMPYHRDALGMEWNGLDARLQTLLIAFMRVVGGGFISAAMSLLFLLILMCRSGEEWLKYAILIVGFSTAVPTLYATILLKRNTPTSPPVGFSVLSVLLLLLGFGFSYFW
jgi:hypothetical protein